MPTTTCGLCFVLELHGGKALALLVPLFSVAARGRSMSSIFDISGLEKNCLPVDMDGYGACNTTSS